MSRFRKIDPRIWNDEKFRSLSDRGKLVFFFLLTHPHMTPFGVMRATLDGLAAEIGWHTPTFRDAILEGCRMGMVRHDLGARCVGLPNFLRYNPPTAPNGVKAFAKTLDLIPECAMKTQAIQGLESLLGRMAPPFLDAFRDAIGDGWRHPSLITETETETETEQEQEKEQVLDTDPQQPLLAAVPSTANGLLEKFQVLPGIKQRKRWKEKVVQCVRKYGADIVEQALEEADLEISNADNPWLYLSGVCRRIVKRKAAPTMIDRVKQTAAMLRAREEEAQRHREEEGQS